MLITLVKRLILRSCSFFAYRKRAPLLASYYKKPVSLIHQIYSSTSNQEARKKAIIKNGMNPYIFRTMLDYTRYPEAKRLHKALKKQQVNWEGFKVIDFGCLVSDYGVYFAKLGCTVTAYDFPEYIEFVKFRSAAEGVQINTVKAGVLYSELFADQTLAVFGEVLEHLDSPLDVVRACVQQKVRFIFTSCYPFGDDYYFSVPGHRRSAYEQQPACLDLLREHYSEVLLVKRERLWIEKAFS